jgi:hypothetical protein
MTNHLRTIACLALTAGVALCVAACEGEPSTDPASLDRTEQGLARRDQNTVENLADCVDKCMGNGLPKASCQRTCKYAPPYVCRKQDNSFDRAVCETAADVWEKPASPTP